MAHFLRIATFDLASSLRVRMHVPLLACLFALFLNCSYLPDARAVELGCPLEIGNCSPTALWVSGDIVRGDLRRISKVLFLGKGQISTIVLFNMGGGDLYEAIKIGRLIHRLRIRTSVGYPIFGQGGALINELSNRIYYPFATDNKNPLPVPSISQDLSFCVSACVVVWAGGYQRFGAAFLAGHKISIAADERATIDGLAASYVEAEYRLSKYLSEMNVSGSYIRHLSSLESEDLDLVFPADLEKYFASNNLLDDIKMLWDCGGAFPSWSDVANLRPAPEVVSQLAACQTSHTAADRLAAWHIVYH